ncbi:MAG: carbohydrate binding domain-containing protein [Ruminococcus sp.]|nr:carbohydrate binding domain-containing protein [Ruminococcus sp.]
MKRILISAIAIFSMSGMVMPSAFAVDESVATNESIVIGNDFEDGNAGKWLPFGNCSIAVDNTNGHGSTTSLKTTDRVRNYEGPSIQSSDMLTPGSEYNVSGWVYLYADSPQTISYTLKTLDSFGTDTYSQIVSSEIEPQQWVNVTGSIIVPEDALTSLLYVECENETVDFAIDDFYVLGDDSAFTNQNGTEFSDKIFMDFEDDFDGWCARGDITVVHTDEFSESGTHSIYSTNRTAVWNGPMVNISSLVEKEESYYYSAYVMYNGSEYENSHGFRLEMQYTQNGVASYNLVAAKTVSKGKWTKIEGYFTIPKEAQNICLYMQTDNIAEGAAATNDDKMSFYLDNVSIIKASIVKEARKVQKIIIAACCAVALIIILLVARVVYKRIKKKKEALELASKDAMTGAYNRNRYEQKIAELKEKTEHCKKLYFALCDVNFLKYLNDNHGHKTGDAAIIRCADMLKNIVGDSGEVYRIGGDEFVCMSEKPIAEKILEAAENESKIDKGYPFMVACGFAQYDEEKYPTITEIIAGCDKEMYAHKQKIKAENQEFSRK